MKRGRWILLLGLVLAIGVSLFAYRAKESGRTSQAAWPDGEQIAVQGENPYYPDLHSLDFVDANTGWVVLVVAADDNHPITTSQVLRTQDGGAHWDQIAELDKTTVDQLKFVDHIIGWAIAENASQTTSGSQAGSEGLNFISQDYGLLLIGCPPYSRNSRLQLLVTTDGGQTWSAHPFPDGFSLDVLSDRVPLQFTDQQHGWILSRYGLLRTQDCGKTWALE